MNRALQVLGLLRGRFLLIKTSAASMDENGVAPSQKSRFQFVEWLFGDIVDYFKFMD